MSTRQRIFGSILDQIVQKISLTVLVYKPAYPLNTIKKIIVVSPPNAELESGFGKWLLKVVRISLQTKAKILFITNSQTILSIEKYISLNNIALNCDYEFSNKWNDYRLISQKLEKKDLLIMISARKGTLSYTSDHDRIPKILSKFFFQYNFIILYPEQKIQTFQPDSNLQFEQGNFSPFSHQIPNLKKLKNIVSTPKRKEKNKNKS